MLKKLHLVWPIVLLLWVFSIIVNCIGTEQKPYLYLRPNTVRSRTQTRNLRSNFAHSARAPDIIDQRFKFGTADYSWNRHPHPTNRIRILVANGVVKGCLLRCFPWTESDRIKAFSFPKIFHLHLWIYWRSVACRRSRQPDSMIFRVGAVMGVKLYWRMQLSIWLNFRALIEARYCLRSATIFPWIAILLSRSLWCQSRPTAGQTFVEMRLRNSRCNNIRLPCAAAFANRS